MVFGGSSCEVGGKFDNEYFFNKTLRPPSGLVDTVFRFYLQKASLSNLPPTSHDESPRTHG